MSDTKPTKKTAEKKTAAKKTPVKKQVVLQSIPSMMFIHTKMVNQATGQELETFSGVPTTLDCPYIEVIWDPSSKHLGVNNVHSKETVQYLTKLNNKGLPQRNNDLKTQGHQPYVQERKIMNTPVDYYMHDIYEVKAFLQMIAINPDFDFDKFIKA
jgi:hypothetical protein